MASPATGYCWRYRRSFLLALGGALVATVVTAIIPLIQRDIIDNVNTVKHTQSIWPLAIALLGAAAVNFGATFVRRYFGGSCPLTCSTTCARKCSARSPGWTARGRTRSTPASS